MGQKLSGPDIDIAKQVLNLLTPPSASYKLQYLVSTRLTWRLPLYRGAQRFLLPVCVRRYASPHIP